MSQRPRHPPTREDISDEDYWDGLERRNLDRRYHELPPPPHYNYYHKVPQYQHPPQPPTPASSNGDKNAASATLTLQQIGGIIIVSGSLFVSGFSAWSNLNKELDIQKNNFDQFKIQIGKDVDDVQSTIKELKVINENMRLQNQKTSEALDRRIQDLDTSLTQIYQKVSAK